MTEATFKKIIIPRFGDSSVLELVTATIAPPAPHHIRVSIIYSGFSGTDINMRIGAYPFQRKPTFTPGYCFVRRVESKGPQCTSTLQKGDLVTCLSIYDAEAEMTNVPEKYLIPVHEGVGRNEAVALVLDWNTAYGMVHRAANVSKGQKVFVHGMSAAIGNAITRLCLLRGAKVYGTASVRNHDLIRSTGATPFVYTDKEWMKVMRDELGGVDAVSDALGYESWDESYDIIARGGIVVGYGGNMYSLLSASGSESDATGAPGSPVVCAMNLTLKGYLSFWTGKRTTFYYISTDDKEFINDVEALFELAKSGKVQVPIRKVWEGLESVKDAHEA